MIALLLAQDQIFGGFTPISKDSVPELVLDALYVEMRERGKEDYELLSVESQIADGINYRLTVETGHERGQLTFLEDDKLDVYFRKEEWFGSEL